MIGTIDLNFKASPGKFRVVLFDAWNGDPMENEGMDIELDSLTEATSHCEKVSTPGIVNGQVFDPNGKIVFEYMAWGSGIQKGAVLFIKI